MTPASKRRCSDVVDLMMKDFKVEMINDDDMHAFSVAFHGPENSIYHGYVWKLSVDMPVDYPFKPPLIRFANTIYHPNIDENTGEICVNLLNESWPAVADLVSVFEQFIPQLLMYPNPEDPYNVHAAALLLTDPATYEARVKDYCERFATAEESSSKEKNEDETEETSEEDILSETNDKMGNLAI